MISAVVGRSLGRPYTLFQGREPRFPFCHFCSLIQYLGYLKCNEIAYGVPVKFPIARTFPVAAETRSMD